MEPTTNKKPSMASLASRIDALEAERAVRNVLSRYMTLCDQPCHDTAYPQLGDLFTKDAIWEGVGELYTQTFGRREGAEAIVSFLNGYLAPNPHFKKNVHFLTSDQVYYYGDKVCGQWIMLQISTYEDDTSEAVGARLTIDFNRDEDGVWKMCHFRTQRLFEAPWNQDVAALLKQAGVNA